MKFPRAFSLAALLVCLHTSSHAWFFFYVPGEAIQAIGDRLNGTEGEHCVSSSAKVGDLISLPHGYSGVVQSLSGPSSRCQGAYPIRAKLELRLPESLRTAEHTHCAAYGAKVGNKYVVRGLGEVVVKRVVPIATQCGIDNKAPIEVIVVSTQQPPQPTSASSSPTQLVPQPLTTKQDDQWLYGEHCVHADAAPGSGYYDAKAGNGVVEKVTRSSTACTDIGFPHLAVVRFSGVSPKLNPQVPQGVSPASTGGTRSIAERLRELKHLREENLITQELYEAKQREILASQ